MTMNNDRRERATLTTEQARFLRRADHVCFDTTMRPDGDNEFGIRVLIRANDSTGEGERTIRIPVYDVSLQDYRSDTDKWRTKTAFEMIQNANYNPEWRTIARQVRRGSVITMQWIRNNQSPVLDEIGWVCDMLRIEVRNGDTPNVYLVSKYVGPDNSARLVRLA